MTAIPADLAIDQGATFSFAFTVHDGGTVDEPGPVRDLTGYSARLQIRKRQGAEVQLAGTSEGGQILLGDTPGGALDPTNGRCRVLLSAALTDSLTTKASVWDFELVNGEHVDRIFEGAVIVDPNITQMGTPAEKVLAR